MLDAWNVNAPPAPARTKPRSGRAIAAVLLALLAAGAGVEAWRRQSGPAPKTVPTQAEPAARAAEMVTVSEVQARQLVVAPVAPYAFSQSRAALGQIAFNEDASTVVAPPFSGRATRLFAKLGDEVKKGDPLFEIESSDVIQAHTDVIAASLAADKSAAQLALAKRVLDRQSGLLAERATSQREVDQARSEYAVAQADLTAAQGALTAARNKLRVVAGLSDQQIARVQQEKIVAAAATVYAPIDGVVTSRRVGPGQYVRSDGAEPLFTLSDMSTMWLKASLPEADAPLVHVGDVVEVRVNALPNRVFKAAVKTIGASADAATRRIVVQSVIDNSDRALRAEMFASFRIFTGRGAETLAVPVEAVIREGARAFVWVEEKPLAFRRRRVVVGAEQDGRMPVTEGLKADERVVGKGALFVDNEWKQ